MSEIFSRKFVFFGGKGGSGKTTCSAGFALNLSTKGIKTLLVSTDPAHSLSHIFNIKIGPKETEITSNLWAIEIDPQIEAKKYMQRIKDTMEKIVSSTIVEEIRRQIDAAYLSPGAEETAIFDKFIELMENKSYEKIVFDTAPTGHTLRLLTLPEILEVWIERLMKKRIQAMKLLKMASNVDELLKEKVKHDPVIEMLTKRKEKFSLARKYLLDKRSSCFIFIMDAERLSILETQNAISLLERHRILVDGIIVNRILPETDDDFLSKRKLIQNRCLDEIRTKFKGLLLGYLPLLDSDIQGKDVLERIGQIFERLFKTQ